MKKKMKTWYININKTAKAVNTVENNGIYDYEFGGFSPKVK